MTQQSLVTDEIVVEGFLADSVVSPGDGKLYVQGGVWNLINTATLPVRQPRIGLAIIVKVPYHLATNQPHRFDVRLLDADEREVAIGDAPPGVATADGKIRMFGGEFAVGRPHGMQPGDEQFVTVAINLDGLIFEKAGIYSFVISVDGSEAKRLRFRVNQVAQPTMTVR